MTRADSAACACLTASQLQTSTVLPLAFADRCDVLAKRAAAGEAIGAGDIAWLREHRAARLSEARLKVLETMAQLTRYLARYAANPHAQPGPAASVLDHVREYQQHGAFADRAITRLLQALASNVDHRKDAESVIARVRAQRDRANQAFARRLARGYEPAQHAQGLVPLHRLWNHEVVHAWKAEEADRENLGDGGGALLAALEDGAIDVVAAVFNVVDQISSVNTGAAVRIAPTDIVAFVPSLERALAAGRRVLLTADHGFTPYCGAEGKVEVGAGTQRIGSRVLGLDGVGAAVPDGFIEIDLASLGGPPQRRAFAWKTGAYLGRPHVGFHGGCSLEEMVVPLAWLRRDGLAVDEPEWWLGDEPLRPRPRPKLAAPPLAPPPPSEPPPGKQAEPAQKTQKTQKTQKMQQVSLLAPAESAVALGLPDALLETLTHDERAVLVLLESNGSARASELAQRLGKNPVRLNGLLAKLRRKLKTAGVDVVESERLPDGETLHKWVG